DTGIECGIVHGDAPTRENPNFVTIATDRARSRVHHEVASHLRGAIDKRRYSMMRSRSFVTVCMITVLVLSSLGPGAAAGALDDATILAMFDQANTADIVTGRLGAKYG